MWSISKQPQFFLQPISLFSFARLSLSFALMRRTRSHYCRSCRETGPLRGAPHKLQKEGNWMGEESCWQRRRVPPLVSKTHADGLGSTTGRLLNRRVLSISSCPVQELVTSGTSPQWLVSCRGAWPELSLPLLSSLLVVLSAGTDCPSLKQVLFKTG